MPGFFGASPDEYVAIFTPNAAGGLRLVGEGYPFQPGDRFLLTFDNHNSVNGIREFARARGAETTYVPSEIPELRVDEQLLTRDLTEVAGEHHNLCACLVQSNFSGVQHPLEWIEQAHDRGWDVLLDAAAYVPTNRLVAGSQVRGVGCPCARSRPASLPRSARLLDRGHDRPVLADWAALQPPPAEAERFPGGSRNPDRREQVTFAAADDQVPTDSVAGSFIATGSSSRAAVMINQRRRRDLRLGLHATSVRSRRRTRDVPRRLRRGSTRRAP